jgi:hypothetical protein
MIARARGPGRCPQSAGRGSYVSGHHPEGGGLREVRRSMPRRMSRVKAVGGTERFPGHGPTSGQVTSGYLRTTGDRAGACAGAS